MFCDEWTLSPGGGSRTSPRRGRQSLGRGCLPDIFVIFSEKPYEIKEMLVRRRGGHAPGAPSQIRHWSQSNKSLSDYKNGTHAFVRICDASDKTICALEIPIRFSQVDFELAAYLGVLKILI